MRSEKGGLNDPHKSPVMFAVMEEAKPSNFQRLRVIVVMGLNSFGSSALLARAFRNQAFDKTALDSPASLLDFRKLLTMPALIRRLHRFVSRRILSSFPSNPSLFENFLSIGVIKTLP